MWSFLPPPPSERTSKICSARNTSKLKPNKDGKDDDQASSAGITLNTIKLQTKRDRKDDDQASPPGITLNTSKLKTNEDRKDNDHQVSSPGITLRQKLWAERVGIAPPWPAIVLSPFSHSNER